MRWKYRYMITSFSGSYKMDEVDSLLLNLKKTVKRIENILKDKTKCEFIPVCIPESMAISETVRLLADLSKYEIIPRQIIINNVMVSDECSFCNCKRAGQSKYINQISEIFDQLNRIEVPLFGEEIKGLQSLTQFKAFLLGTKLITVKP